jgi:hypothetical protein
MAAPRGAERSDGRVAQAKVGKKKQPSRLFRKWWNGREGWRERRARSFFIHQWDAGKWGNLEPPQTLGKPQSLPHFGVRDR